jgi:hypothetical protein
LSFFETFDTFGHEVVKNLTKLLSKYDFKKKKIISYVKDEGSSLNTMISTLKSIVSCDILSLAKSFQNSCFGHAFFKAC